MRSVFLSFLITAFIGVFAIKATDFHCSGSDSHAQADVSHNAHHSHHDHDTSDKQSEPCHDHCPPHLHSCCTSVFVFNSETQISLPVPAEIVFSENIYLIKPAPVLDGPFQPPRLT